VWLLMLPFSHQRAALTVWSFIGALIGYFVLTLPVAFAIAAVLPSDPSAERGMVALALSLITSPAVGVLIIGGGSLMREKRLSRANNRCTEYSVP
jgi:hypothetical protein